VILEQHTTSTDNKEKKLHRLQMCNLYTHHFMNYSQKHSTLTDIGAEMSAIRRKTNSTDAKKKKSGSKISFMNDDHR
jgi:hypothetical protein